MNVDDICEAINSSIDHLNENFKSIYCSNIKEKNINGKVLSCCDLDELKQELKMAFGDWQLFKNWILGERFKQNQKFASKSLLKPSVSYSSDGPNRLQHPKPHYPVHGHTISTYANDYVHNPELNAKLMKQHLSSMKESQDERAHELNIDTTRGPNQNRKVEFYVNHSSPIEKTIQNDATTKKSGEKEKAVVQVRTQMDNQKSRDRVEKNQRQPTLITINSSDSPLFEDMGSPTPTSPRTPTTTTKLGRFKVEKSFDIENSTPEADRSVENMPLMLSPASALRPCKLFLNVNYTNNLFLFQIQLFIFS